jgi:thioredoxin 1
MSAVIQATKRDFGSLICSDEQPVLVDFSAAWCRPCKMMDPVLEAFASEHKGDITVVKLDIDEVPNVAHQYSIRSVPTLAIFHGGRQIAAQPGMMNKAQLASFVDRHLRKSGHGAHGSRPPPSSHRQNNTAGSTTPRRG